MYSRELPADIVAGATGVPVIDQAVRALYRDGYLHNHARMWLASYVVHLRKIHWRAGPTGCTPICSMATSPATTFPGNGFGTASRKPHLFNAENGRAAPPSWHSSAA